nr:hypothetical protein [Tanacetum cinerariifolium]
MQIIWGTTKEETNSYKELVMVKTRLQLIKHRLINPWVTKLRFSKLRFLNRTLPINTITNLKEDLKGITTRSGIAFKAPMIPTTSSPPKIVERETEVTKDTVPPTNNGRTKDVQPLVVQIETQVPNYEPFFLLLLSPLKLPFADALIPMPKYASTIKSLLTNKDKLIELARTPLNEHCSAVLLKSYQKSWGTPTNFLSHNKLSLAELSPTCMTLELADRSISQPVGVVEDVFVKVGKFHFSADFVVVDFDADPRVPLILERSFLKTGRALIDVHEGELTLRVGKEAITFNLDQTSRYSANYDAEAINRIDVIGVACEEYSQEVLGFFVKTNAFLVIDDEPISLEIDDSYYDLEGDILLLEEFINDYPLSPPLPPQELKVVEPNNEKSSIDEPPKVELKDLPPHLEYAFLEGDDKLPVIIAKYLKDEEKTALIKVLKSHKQALAWQLFDIKGDFIVVENEENKLIPTRLVTGWRVCIDYLKLNDASRKDHFPLPFMDQMLERLAGNEYYCFLDEKTMEVFMDDFSVFGNSFRTCLSYLDKMLKRGEDTNLFLNWEKSHFMVKEGVVLGHKISKNGIEVDKAKVDVIAKLPHPTTVKGKLKTRWTGLFTITQVFSYGTVELSQTDGPNFKVNGHRLKHYFGGDIPQLVVLDLQTFPKDQ